MSDKMRLMTSSALLAMGLALSQGGFSQTALAQDATPAGEGDGSEIVVTGLRASLQNTASTKRNSNQIQDSILAEDIGKLPDTNIAETLQRIPGVQISRNTRGEGNAYVVHGLKQVMTTVNGRQLFGTTNRTALLLDYSADILSGVDVFKTATSDQIEGGLGGLVNIHTAHPFDFDGLHVAGTGSLAYSEFQDKVGPRISGVVSNRWSTGAGEFGLLLGGQYERYYSAGYQASTNGYADNTTLFDVDGDGSTGGEGDVVTLPGQVRMRYETGDRERSALYGAAQWAPNDTLTIHADALYTYSGGHSFTQQLAINTGSTTGIGTPVFKDGSTELQDFSLADPRVQSAVGASDNPYDTVNFAAGFTYTDGPWTISAEGSYVRSEGPFYYRNGTLTGYAESADFSLAGDTPDVAINGFDLNDPASYPSTGYYEYGTSQYGREPSMRADLTYELDGGPITALKAGVRWAEHRAIYDFYFVNGNAITQPVGDVTGLTPNDLFTDQKASTNQWLAYKGGIFKDAERARALFGLAAGDPAPNPANHYDYTEETMAAYVQAQYALDLGALPIDGNIGMRYVRTDGEQTVLVQNDEGEYEPLSGGSPYDNWLPSVNMRLKFTPDLFLRLAYSNAITRPDYGNLSPAVLLNPVNLTGSGGNPDLRPTKADQFDASLEYYFGSANYASLALFQKNVTGFIQTFYDEETIDGDVYQISRPRNSNDGKIRGFEIAYQQFFDFLPGALSGLGFQGNYTYVDSALEQIGLPGKVPADQLSKHAYNLTGIYEKGPVSIHVSYNWRSKSVQTNSPAENGTVWNAPQESLDLSGTFYITDWLSVKADVVNATAAYQNQYYGTPLRPSLSNQLDRTYQLGFHVNF